MLLVALGCGSPAQAPAAPAPPPAPAASPSESGRPDEPGRGLRSTGPPRIAYVDGSVLRHPDGSTLQLPTRWGFTAIVRYDGGYLVTDDRYLEGAVGMQRLDADGRILEQWTGTGPPEVSADGRVAWVSLVPGEGGGTGPTLLHADSLDGGEEVTQELRRDRMPFLGGWFRGRLVYDTWGASPSFLTDLVGPPRAVPRAEDPGVLRPDGAYRARVTREGVEILHHDGQVSQLVRDRGLTRTVTDLAWEDDDHLLATLVRGGRRAVARIAMDGSMSLATDWQRGAWPGFAFLAPLPPTG